MLEEQLTGGTLEGRQFNVDQLRVQRALVWLMGPRLSRRSN